MAVSKIGGGEKERKRHGGAIYRLGRQIQGWGKAVAGGGGGGIVERDGRVGKEVEDAGGDSALLSLNVRAGKESRGNDVVMGGTVANSFGQRKGDDYEMSASWSQL
uniref:DUF834 domain-containing protein n=1 Tax=Oryza barthii TaxID=65489 RepID=A0A0D3HTD2_9ORYZ